MNTTIEKETRAPARPQAEQFVTPNVNVFENKDGYVIEAELPGVGKNGLEITIENNALTIVGHRENGAVKANPLYRETNDAGYRRSFELDPVIDSTKIEARIEQGLLTLRLPRSERAKPHKITVAE